MGKPTKSARDQIIIAPTVRDFGQRNQTPDQIQEVSAKGALLRAVRGQTGRGRCRQTGMLRAVQVSGREEGVGQVRADEGVVPGRRQIRSRGADVGRSQADGGPGQTETVAGEGTWTQTEAGWTET